MNQLAFNHMNSDNISDIAVKATLPVSVSGMTLFGVALPDIVFILTIIYTVLLIINQGYLLYKRIKEKYEPKE